MPFSDSILLTRQELYDQVWSEPIVGVAARLGLSDRGLSKLCARFSIPVPPRGWWAKKRHGHRVRQPSLPPSDLVGPIRFRPSTPQPALEEPIELLRETSPAWRIDVPEGLQISHPMVRHAATAMRSAARERTAGVEVLWRERYRAKLLRPGKEQLDIAVSRPLLTRALRIMQVLLVAFEKRGYPVSVNAKDETIVTVLEEPFQIALKERLRQVVVKRAYGSGMDLEPSGHLMLRIGSTYENAGVADRPPRLIEESLNRFVARLVSRALDKKRQRAIHEEREQRWQVRDEELRRLQQARDSEELRRRTLRTLAARWARHQRTVAFVGRVEAYVRNGQCDPGQEDAVLRWVAWARQELEGDHPVHALVEEPWPVAELPPASIMPWGWK